MDSGLVAAAHPTSAMQMLTTNIFSFIDLPFVVEPTFVGGGYGFTYLH
jgi:hypothetical protein